MRRMQKEAETGGTKRAGRCIIYIEKIRKVEEKNCAEEDASENRERKKKKGREREACKKVTLLQSNYP